MAIISEYITVIESGFQILAAATEKAPLPILSLSFGTKSCLEMLDLRVREISEKCSSMSVVKRKNSNANVSWNAYQMLAYCKHSCYSSFYCQNKGIQWSSEPITS